MPTLRPCIAAGNAGVFRFPAQTSGASGHASLGPGLVATSQNFAPNGDIESGGTWRFQAWYRDPNGSCGTGFNLSNGVKVEFTQ